MWVRCPFQDTVIGGSNPNSIKSNVVSLSKTLNPHWFSRLKYETSIDGNTLVKGVFSVL